MCSNKIAVKYVTQFISISSRPSSDQSQHYLLSIIMIVANFDPWPPLAVPCKTVAAAPLHHAASRNKCWFSVVLFSDWCVPCALHIFSPISRPAMCATRLRRFLYVFFSHFSVISSKTVWYHLHKHSRIDIDPRTRPSRPFRFICCIFKQQHRFIKYLEQKIAAASLIRHISCAQVRISSCDAVRIDAARLILLEFLSCEAN